MRPEPGSVGERAGLAADYLGFVERGENVPTLTVILKLAKALGVDTVELLSAFDRAALRSMDL